MAIKIQTYNQLESLVDFDVKQSNNKELAQLFLNGMKDWPTYNQTAISDYVFELKSYFGNPLTIDAINSNKKNFDLEHESWRHESGSSIIEMLEAAKLMGYGEDFDKILGKIIEYYQDEFENTDFVADLYYRTTEEGGRKSPAFPKYRPQIKFEFDEMQTSGEQIFMNKDEVRPGESVRAKIRILGVEYFAGKLRENMDFEFREGARIIGTGKILLILNDKLKMPAGNIV